MIFILRVITKIYYFYLFNANVVVYVRDGLPPIIGAKVNVSLSNHRFPDGSVAQVIDHSQVKSNHHRQRHRQSAQINYKRCSKRAERKSIAHLR